MCHMLELSGLFVCLGELKFYSAGGGGVYDKMKCIIELLDFYFCSFQH